jgi:predicted HAD superfamily Cof-like phosphohydrolase
MMKPVTFFDSVSEFQESFGQITDAVFDYNTQLTKTMLNLRKKLIEEEAKELSDAIDSGDQLAIKKEAADLLYVVTGLFVDYGWPMTAIFNRVHASNMSKLGEDGKPIYREDGKVMKSEKYTAPNLEGV